MSSSSISNVDVKIPILPKLPTGNLAPSKKQPIAVVKNVSEKVAQVFGSDDDDEVLIKSIILLVLLL